MRGDRGGHRDVRGRVRVRRRLRAPRLDGRRRLIHHGGSRGMAGAAAFFGLLMRHVLFPAVVEQCLAGLVLDGLALQQHACHQMHLVLMCKQHLTGAFMRLLHDARHLVVDATRGLVGIILRVAVIAAQEHLVVRLAENLRAEFRGHAVLRHHRPCDLRRALQVV